MNSSEINYIDLFSGIGGFTLGIKNAGVSIKNHFFSEIDKDAIKVYEKHFPEAIGVGDVSTIRDVSKFGKIDLVTFGFPCQDLSIAGKGRGLEGSRSGLFFEAIRLIRELKPTYFVFENVKGLLSSNNGNDFKRCLQEIADLGFYDGEWQLVNTRWFLPQNRERVYFIGHLRGKSSPKVFPFCESDFATSVVQRQSINTITARNGNNDTVGSYVVESKQYEKIGKDGRLKSNHHLASCLTGGGHSGGNHSDMDLLIEKTKRNPQGQRISSVKGASVCLSSQGGGQGAKTGLYVVPRGKNLGGYKEVNNSPTITTSRFEHNNYIVPVLTPNREKKRQNGRRFKEDRDPSFTLTAQDQHGVYDGHSIRRLTPLECERLQGFPDNWTEGLSDSARYRCLGNAVTVRVVTEIMKRLKKG